jgi:uncharacterized protein (TIGR02588 family)
MSGQTQQKRRSKPGDIPPAEWAAAALGLMIVLFVLGFVLYEAAAGDSSPPDLQLNMHTVRPIQSGYVVEVRIVNRGGTTASAVRIEGVLRDSAGNQERAEATVDYVAPHSRVTAGLFFRKDPRTGELRLRPLGYEEP